MLSPPGWVSLRVSFLLPQSPSTAGGGGGGHRGCHSESVSQRVYLEQMLMCVPVYAPALCSYVCTRVSQHMPVCTHRTHSCLAPPPCLPKVQMT